MEGNYNIGSTVFQNWTLKQLIGEGSYGKVYEIERESFGVYRAALKVITVPQNETELKNAYEEGMDDTSVHNYFYSIVEDIVWEFALMSKLKGITNVVSYEDHEVIPHRNGIGWDILIRMELLTPLLTYAYKHPFSRRDIIKLGIDMCRALELCQKYNIVHRDVKPENIFVSEAGDFKLGDFGIARTMEKTMSGLSKKGTYSYMAPEVYRGGEYGFGVDIYSLGIVMYRLLNNNRLPFLPPSPEPITYSAREKALAKRMGGETPPMPVNGVGRLGEIVLKACSFDPKERYTSPMQMRQELEAIQYNPSDAEIIYPSGDELVLHENQYVSRKQTVKDSSRAQTEGGTQSIFESYISSEETSKTESVFGQSIPSEAEESIKAESAFASVPEPMNKNAPKQSKTGKKKSASKKGFWIAIVCTVIAIVAGFAFTRLLSTPASKNDVISSESIKNQFQYINYNDSYVAITKYIGTEQDVQIPENIDGIPVIEIADTAFFANEKLRSVEIPEGIQFIGASTFEGCRFLTEIRLPSTLMEIGKKVFCDCSALPYIEIPQNVSAISQQSFLNCSALSDVILHEGVLATIGVEAFKGCGIKNLVIPNSVSIIDESAFQNCAVETVILPEKLDYLGENSFAECANLTEIYVPGSVGCINVGTFMDCYSIKTVTLGEGTESIGFSAFSGLKKLESVKLPESLKNIEDCAFDQVGLIEITIPAGVERIGENAITGDSLQDIYFLGMETELPIGSVYSYNLGLTIHGYRGATAETFANDLRDKYYNVVFKALD